MTTLTNDVPVTDDNEDLGLLWEACISLEDNNHGAWAALDRIKSRLTSQPAPGDLVERARTYVASSMHDRDKSWGDLVLAGERDDCPEMRMVLKAMQSEAALSAAQQGQGEPVAWRFRRVDGSEPGPWKSLGSSVRPNLNREYRYQVEPIYAHPPTAPQPDRDGVDQAVNECLVRITEAAVMCLDADDDDTTRLEAFGRGIEGYLRSLATTTDQSARSDAVGEAVAAERERCLAAVDRIKGCEVQVDGRQRFSLSDLNRQHRMTCEIIRDEITGEAVWTSMDDTDTQSGS